MAKANAAPYEWGAKKFKTLADLEELLRDGYFSEGSAWGSIRQGWVELVAWNEVFEAISKNVEGRMYAYVGGMAKASLNKKIPEQIRAQAKDKQGQRLWLAFDSEGFAKSSSALWALLEKREISGASGFGEKKKMSSKTRL